MRLLWIVALAGLLCMQPATAPPAQVNVILVSPPGESWTQVEQARAIGAALDATAWWTRNSAVAVPAFELGWTAIITPTDFSYSVFAWEQPYYNHASANLTVFVIDNSTTHKTMDGAIGWSQVPCQAVTAILGNNQDELATVIAHEYGHAVFDLEHAPLGAADIMAPSLPLAAYEADTIGYYTRRAMGEPFNTIYIP